MSPGSHPVRYAIIAAALSLPLGACHVLAGFDDLAFENRTNTLVRLGQGQFERIDLLFVIDDSGSMASKQQVLAENVSDAVQGLVNPLCVSADGVPAVQQPVGPDDPCPAETTRVFAPINDIHIGVISTSLGSRGGNVLCSGPDEDRRSHLLRVGPDGNEVPTYAGAGYLAWDPRQTQDPPGESDAEVLTDNLKKLILGVGQRGCGAEAPLEAWYRFLVDPEPYDSISVVESQIVLAGRDEVLLEERKNFLRQRSIVAVVQLSDENDCSIKPTGFNWRLLDGGRLPRATTICATKPSSACCHPCSAKELPGCDEATNGCCKQPGCSNFYTPDEDKPNLRCFDQKRRFGHDFLWPISRYVQGLTSATVPDRDGDLVTNPLFSNLGDLAAFNQRRADDVLFVAIAGVPWQDIARKNIAGEPDLTRGLQTSREMRENGGWELIAGNIESGTAPTDPLMVESPSPRSGDNPPTGAALADPTSSYYGNPINGHEWTTQNEYLQYACIFPLETAVPCLDSTCACLVPSNNPVCQQDDDSYVASAQSSGAVPSLRQINLVNQLGDEGIVGSVCPAQQDDPTRSDYGYRPVVDALISRLNAPLGTALCLEAAPTIEQDGSHPCQLVEVQAVDTGTCDCSSAGRFELDESFLPLRDEILSTSPDSGWNCFCGIEQTNQGARSGCREQPVEPVTNLFGNLVHGWCSIVPTDLAAPGLLKSCRASERAGIRIVGDAKPRPGAEVFLSCSSVQR